MTDQSQSARERRDALVKEYLSNYPEMLHGWKHSAFLNGYDKGLTDPVVKAMADALHQIVQINRPGSREEVLANERLANYNAAVESLNG